MVYYYKTNITTEEDLVETSREYTIYMGKDKVENDPLIKYSHPKYLWFHVDNYSSAHVYLKIDDEDLNYKSFDDLQIDEALLNVIGQLTKNNSIKGNKLPNVTVIYTPVQNLHTDGSMDIGTVTFKNNKMVKRVPVGKKQNHIINQLNKTKTEGSTEDFIADQKALLVTLEKTRKLREKEEEQLQKLYQQQKKAHDDPYGDFFGDEVNVNSNEFRNENWVEEEFW
jgi:predicted ribosome quality control (RQC) complex YloA/Tae2 family protein